MRCFSAYSLEVANFFDAYKSFKVTSNSSLAIGSKLNAYAIIFSFEITCSIQKLVNNLSKNYSLHSCDNTDRLQLIHREEVLAIAD